MVEENEANASLEVLKSGLLRPNESARLPV